MGPQIMPSRCHRAAGGTRTHATTVSAPSYLQHPSTTHGAGLAPLQQAQLRRCRRQGSSSQQTLQQRPQQPLLPLLTDETCRTANPVRLVRRPLRRAADEQALAQRPSLAAAAAAGVPCPAPQEPATVQHFLPVAPTEAEASAPLDSRYAGDDAQQAGTMIDGAALAHEALRLLRRAGPRHRGSSSSSSSSSSHVSSAPAMPYGQDAADWEQLLLAVQRSARSLRPHQASLVLYAAAKAGATPGAPLLAALLAGPLAPAALPQLPPAGLVNTLWALGVLCAPPHQPWLDAACAAASVLLQTGRLSPPQLASLLWALGALRAKPPRPWLVELLQHLQPLLPQLGPSELVNCMWALSRLGFRPGAPWTSAWFGASHTMLLQCCSGNGRHRCHDSSSSSSASSVCTPAHLACMAGSIGLLQLDPPRGRWLAAFRAAVEAQAPSLTPRHAATITCGLAKRCVAAPPHWVELLLRRMLLLPQDRSGGSHSGVVQSCTPTAAARAADLAAATWALPRLLHPTAREWAAGVRGRQLLAALTSASLPLLPGATGVQLVQLAVGLAGCGHYPGAHWLKVHENAVAGAVRRHPLRGSSHGDSGLSAANRARLRAAVCALWGDDVLRG